MRIFAALFGTLISFSVAAFEYRQQPLDEMTQNSDLVVIATVQSSTEAAATFRVLKTLKGAEDVTDVALVLKTGISEANPVCCSEGRKYLLFLQRTPKGQYVSANGRFGVVEIP